MIIARTDARHVTGMEDAIVTRTYAAGADDLSEGLSRRRSSRPSRRDRRASARNMTEFGETPIIPVATFKDLGYRMVIHPLSMMRLAMGEVVGGFVN